MINFQVLRPGDEAKSLKLTCGKQDRKVREFYIENSGTKTRAGLFERSNSVKPSLAHSTF